MSTQNILIHDICPSLTTDDWRVCKDKQNLTDFNQRHITLQKDTFDTPKGILLQYNM